MAQSISKLIDRRQQCEKFQEVLGAILERRFYALEFYGIDGIGKSRVMGAAREAIREKDFPFASIDFMIEPRDRVETQAVIFLMRLCDQLDRYFDLSQPRMFFSSLLIEGKAGGAGEESRLIEPKPEQYDRFLHTLAENLAGRPLVLLLDSLEYCGPILFDWLGNFFLAQLKTREVCLAVFLAGRGPRLAESSWPVVLKTASEAYRLDALDFKSTTEHIRAIAPGVDYAPASDAIYALSKGHPYSTEAIVAWLQAKGVDVKDVGLQRDELAQRLYNEVIRRYILSRAEDWVLPFLEIASHFRQFTTSLLADFLVRYYPEVGPQTPGWYIQRLALLQKHPLNLVYLGKDVYYLEPTLRRLLHTVQVIVKPEEALAIHQRAREYLEAELQHAEKVSSYARAALVLELLYHTLQAASIQGGTPNLDVELMRLLEQYFRRRGPHDQETLNFLGSLLEQDMELAEQASQEVCNQLAGLIRVFLAAPPVSHPTWKSGVLQIIYIPPADYQVNWYLQGQVVVSSEGVSSAQRFSLDDWRENTQDIGSTAFGGFLPVRAQEFIQSQQDMAIQLYTNRVDVPWELLHDDKKFLCLSRPVGRIPVNLKEPRVHPARQKGQPLQALVIGDPREDLPGARAEAEAVANALAEAGVRVELLLGSEATARNFSVKIRRNRYELIHYAGHAYYDRQRPRLSGLVFSDTPYFAEELERMLNSQAFIFLSACKAGKSEQQSSQAGMVGDFIEGVATAALLGGALGCLGPLWEIHDQVAKDFALEFYRFLLDGQPIGEAVRRARLAVCSSCLDPDCWKSWVLYGKPSDILELQN